MPYQGFPASGVFVEIPRGMSTGAIARRLDGSGVVRSGLAFRLLCRWRGRQTLQAGEYFFDQPLRAVDVWQKLAEGRIFYHTVVVPEGRTMFEIAEMMEKAGLVSYEEFLRAASDTAPIRDLAPRVRSLEGFLFPATYLFPRRVTASRVVGVMVSRFRQVWASLPETSKQWQRLSVEQVVTLASLVEKETGAPEERPLVAAVFQNRLRRRMALQCDPTVIYALELAGKYNGSLSSKDLRFNSPYNTYRRPGLPPGPISNPGEASLRAALAPPKEDYLYFVSNTQGGHFFSRTLAEHNRNVTRYRRLLAQNGKSDSAAAAQRNRR